MTVAGNDDRFVRQARRVSDYLVASGSPLGADLEKALRTFDEAEGSPEAHSELRSIVSRVYPTIEKRTLAAVLSGRFRPGEMADEKRNREIFSPTNLVAALGLALILASLHWTYWSTRAGAVIASLDSVLETQRSLNIEDIVHTRDLCQYQQAQLDDQDIYRFVMATRDMSYYDKIWVASRNEADKLALEFNPVKTLYDSAVETATNFFMTEQEELAEEIEFGPQILGPGFDLSAVQAEADKLGDTQALIDPVCALFFTKDGKSARSVKAQFDWYKASFLDLAEAIPLESGTELFRGTGTASIEVLKKELQESRTVVHRWLLPTLHGALGAVIFCLVRAIREPFLLPLGKRDVMLRIFFGAFVGYLISALFIPSGMLGSAAGGTAPITSLAAFVFGYSLDSFIALLNRMNDYISRLPDQKKAGGG